MFNMNKFFVAFARLKIDMYWETCAKYTNKRSLISKAYKVTGIERMRERHRMS